MIAVGEGAGVGEVGEKEQRLDGKRAVRKRATGTREHVVAYLTEAGELYDKDGLASTRLAAAVGYPGSSVAFAQLLSGMERSGLIVREVHGKRTYRITLGDVEGFGPVSRAPARPVAAIPDPVAAPGDFDYDELARRLLVQVVRRLAATPEAPVRQARQAPKAVDDTVLDTVADLEHELASAWTKHGKLAEENIRLREQLRSAQRSLSLARDQFRRLPASSSLDSAEVILLQRLLSQDLKVVDPAGVRG
jgi:hypothetical protein